MTRRGVVVKLCIVSALTGRDTIVALPHHAVVPRSQYQVIGRYDPPFGRYAKQSGIGFIFIISWNVDARFATNPAVVTIESPCII